MLNARKFAGFSQTEMDYIRYCQPLQLKDFQKLT